MGLEVTVGNEEMSADKSPNLLNGPLTQSLMGQLARLGQVLGTNPQFSESQS